ncbi:surfeit locus protein 6 isoform X2 [Hypanus sabinus]|uniref:surfeit locus protein 6 isoform X2 n=1 Tax=Hypanus sabinus TaxID=79690 RepID=UPI0028C39D94|nr:surfeit locus protein 6 isoform X2 [Hypanus sabinus]
MDALTLAAKDKYIQSLGSKVCAVQSQEARNRKFASKRERLANAALPKKKRRKKQQNKEKRVLPSLNREQPKTSQTETKQNKTHQRPRVNDMDVGSFSTVNILRQRLHEKIQESQGQGNQKGLSSEELEKKRLRRKQERERKKRKRKELQMKKQENTVQASNAVTTQNGEKKDKVEKVETDIIFNKVEVTSEAIKDKKQKKKEKKRSIKGGITPLTGRNYKQLLSRLEAHKNKIEELKSKDENKAKKVETKMKWTNILYKAEGLKIKDNEEMLKASLKRKEKLKSQRQKRWEKRTEHVVEKMQQRQDRRKTNLKRKKEAVIERRKNKARKKGRILPEDLKKVNL